MARTAMEWNGWGNNTRQYVFPGYLSHIHGVFVNNNVLSICHYVLYIDCQV